MDYQKQRVQQRKSFIEDKQKEEGKYAKHKEKARRHCDTVRNVLDFLLHHESEIEKDILHYQGGKTFLEFLRKRQRDASDIAQFILKEGIIKNESALVKFSYEIMPTDAKKKLRKDTLKEITRDYAKAENKLKSYISPLQIAVKDLIRVMQNPAHASISREIKDPLVNTLENLLDTFDLEKYENLRELVQQIRGSLKNEYVARAKAFQEALQLAHPSFKEAMLNVAQSNLASLEEECKTVKDQKKIYSATPEGLLMEFATYHLESRKAEEHEPMYKESLLRKAEEKFVELQHFEKEIPSHLKQLTEKGYLTESEAILLRSILERESQSSEAGKESLEDIQLRALIISDFGISYEESIRIARLTRDENVDRASGELSRKVGHNLATLLLKKNPELFLMNGEQLRKYMQRFQEVVEMSSKYRMVDDFNPQKAPQNFSSFDALKETKGKLYQIVKQAVSEPIESAADSARSEIEGIKNILDQEGFNSQMAWTILQRGFYFSGQYFVGNHRIPTEHLEKNIARGASTEVDKKQYRRELKKIISQDAILFKLGGYSLNPHTKEIASEALKRAVNYILSHHPLEDERRESQ